MKKLLLLFLLSPIALLSQVCFTETNTTNADSIQYCITDASCHSSCDGEITITVFGPNQPYYFEWGSSTPIANDNQRNNLCAGNYSVTITDNNGNLVDFQSNLIEEPSELGIFRTITDPSCFNYIDGDIDITTLGDSPFSWSWDNGFNTEDLPNLISGQYILTTTDSNNCYRIDTFNLSNPEEVSSLSVSDTLSCIGICDANGIIIPQNGISPFSYLWDDGQTTAVATNLCFGINNVVVTDVNGCFTTNSVDIQNPDSLKLSSVITDSACYQICDGEITVNITGGTSPYNISWMLGFVVIDTLNTNINSLCPDIYSVTYSDVNNCIETENIVLYERDSFILQTTITNDSCFNSCSGQIEVNILNPENPSFIYNWSNGVNSSNIISNLCADTFNLEIIDGRLCRDTFEFIVSEPLSISIDSFFVVDNQCYNDGNGSISVNLTGGTGNLLTNWTGLNGFSSTNEDISNLNNGTYSIYIEDDYACTKDTIFTVLHPDSLFATFSVQNVSCFSFSDGLVDVNIQGGITPYTISWNSVLSDSVIIDSLIAADYIYIITDSNNCIFTDTATISEPNELIISDSITNVLCKGYYTGNIDLTLSGGTAPYNYIWNTLETNEDLQNIPDGIYSVIVSDINSCTSNANYIITEPQFHLTSNIISTDILCFGENTGDANLNVSGGTTPYLYQWSNSETTQNISSLIAGSYTVTIVDSNGCDTTNTVDILENTEIITTYSSSNVLCYGDSTGTLNLSNTIGGTPPYNYDCSNGFSTNTITTILVNAGQYTVVVSDANSCTETLQFNVQDASELISYISNINVDCNGNNNGSIDFTPFGGIGSYLFLWNNNETTEDINNLTPGIYTVLLTDGNGCLTYDTTAITEPDELIISSSLENSICNSEALGSIDITASGGTGGLSYNWSNSEITEDLNNIIAGDYTLDLTDGNNCILTESFTLTEPLAFLDVFNVTDVMCYGESTASVNFLISGNTSPYTFSWSNGMNTQNIDYLSAADYSVFVQDANNCSETFFVSITQPEELVINYTVFDASCEENNDGSITTNISGGSLPYAYQWSNGDYYADLIGLSKGLYTLEVRDANSCVYPTQTMEVGFEGYDGCIEIPTGFTPNNDGIHDEWAIYGLYNFPDVVVSVHNRWGQKVFYSDTYNVPWDGKKNGVDLPIATYYYVIELKDSEKVFNGTVTIKR
tara:strand:- start:2552 stop:6121 length:3570 start_codon:yes stop_codon:yes gene_type:complete